MQVVRPVVRRSSLYGLPSSLNRAVPDPIGDPADGGAEVGAPGDIPVELVEPEDDVAHLAVSVRRLEPDQDRAVVGDLGNRARCCC